MVHQKERPEYLLDFKLNVKHKGSYKKVRPNIFIGVKIELNAKSILQKSTPNSSN